MNDSQEARNTARASAVPFDVTPVPAEVVEEALLEIDEEEIARGIREIRETGGYQLRDFYAELNLPRTINE
jgi:hypothetical protein